MVSFSIATFLIFSTSALADNTYYPDKTHGILVYLSPAKHTPEKYGCDNYAESANAYQIALKAKDYLLARGYIVRVGTGDFQQNTTSSNNWGSDVHIPIHSNATTFDCEGKDYSKGGSWTMYETGDTSDQEIASDLLFALKDYSPGTNDKMGTDEAFSGITLHELRATNMPAGYAETAFHTFGPDKDWLLDHKSVGDRIGYGIYRYFDFASCSNTPCYTITSFSTDEALANKKITTEKITIDGETITVTVIEEDPPLIEKIDFGYDIKTFGKPHSLLERELRLLLEGNESKIFNSKTAGFLNGVVVSEDGTAVVDFADFSHIIPNSSTTAGKSELLKSLNRVVFQFEDIQRVYYQFDGSHSDWAYWLEAMEGPVTRK